eukprot:5305887-Prymnesium_polylepis.1
MRLCCARRLYGARAPLPHAPVRVTFSALRVRSPRPALTLPFVARAAQLGEQMARREQAHAWALDELRARVQEADDAKLRLEADVGRLQLRGEGLQEDVTRLEEELDTAVRRGGRGARARVRGLFAWRRVLASGRGSGWR